jgi:hypothetical protein
LNVGLEAVTTRRKAVEVSYAYRIAATAGTKEAEGKIKVS